MNLRQVRKKTKSVSNVKKITRSMQLVSAIKMKRAQQVASESRPYQEQLESIIKKVMFKKNIQLSPLLLIPKNASKHLAIVISSNKGLCGSFNIDILRYLLKKQNDIKTDYVTIGKKAASFISKTGNILLADYSSNNPLQSVSALFSLVVDAFLSGTYQKVSIVYNRFISTLRSETVEQVILPFPVSQNFDTALPLKEVKNEYLIEPTPEGIVDSLLRSYIEEKIRNCIIQSEAGEHSARMIAMKNATDNANDVIYNLTLLGNKLRQEKITNELLDMVTAKESISAE